MVDITVAILAGGKSSRMGTDKALLSLADKPVIQHVIDRTADIGQQETILISNQPDVYEQFGLPVFTDVLPDKGSLGGIYTALTHAQYPYVLVVACDMPFVSTALLKFMVSQITDDLDVVVPRVDGYPQGLHAIYGRRCLNAIRQQLDADQLKIIRFYDDVRVRYLDESDYQQVNGALQSFTNVNTPEEFAEAKRQLD